MRMNARCWADLTTRDFATLDPNTTVAVLPVAAIEQHGPHLPLAVDTLLVDGIVRATLPLLAPELPVLILPTQAIGLSPEHERFAGTLTLSPQTLLALWCEIGECVAKSGVRKLLFLNAHGGQVSATDIAARLLRARCELIAYSTSWFNLPIQSVLDAAFNAEEQRFGVHGGAIETSMMLALHPELVDMSAAQDFVSSSRTRAADFPLLGNGRSAQVRLADAGRECGRRSRRRHQRQRRQGPARGRCGGGPIGRAAGRTLAAAAVDAGGSVLTTVQSDGDALCNEGADRCDVARRVECAPMAKRDRWVGGSARSVRPADARFRLGARQAGLKPAPWLRLAEPARLAAAVLRAASAFLREAGPCDASPRRTATFSGSAQHLPAGGCDAHPSDREVRVARACAAHRASAWQRSDQRHR